MERLQWLGKLAQKAAPYVLLELALPGGTLFALLLFLHRRGSFPRLSRMLDAAGDMGRRMARDLERESLTRKHVPMWPVTMNH
jgi:hypothetical protein